MRTTLLHGTCVEIKGRSVLIMGNPGMGKSSLALQLLDRGAVLVSDDQTCLSLEGKDLMACPPPSLSGLMEVRGVGICTFPYQKKSLLKLFVEICDHIKSERLPEHVFKEYHGVRLPYLKLLKGDPLAAIKVELKIG